MKIRIIYDLCRPTKDRRPTTTNDIYNDVIIKDLNSEEELKYLLNDLTYMDEEEIAENLDKDVEDISIEEYAEEAISYLNDPGDGSPNILYLSINGKEIPGTMPYDCVANLDLEHIKLKDLLKAIVGDYED